MYHLGVCFSTCSVYQPHWRSERLAYSSDCCKCFRYSSSNTRDTWTTCPTDSARLYPKRWSFAAPVYALLAWHGGHFVCDHSNNFGTRTTKFVEGFHSKPWRARSSCTPLWQLSYSFGIIVNYGQVVDPANSKWKNDDDIHISEVAKAWALQTVPPSGWSFTYYKRV